MTDDPASQHAANSSEGLPSGNPRTIDDPRVVREVRLYRSELEKGNRPQRQRLLARYPEIADELAVCLDGLEFVERVAPQLRETSRGPRPHVDKKIGPSVALGDFRILREIGRGGMGVVYEAEQLSLGRRVAIKVLPFAAVLDQRQLQRFQNEAHAAATLHHQNIVPVYSVGCDRGVHYYAMQYIEGHTLAEVIRQLRSLAGREAPDAIVRGGSVADLAGDLVSGQLAPAGRDSLRPQGSNESQHDDTSVNSARTESAVSSDGGCASVHAATAISSGGSTKTREFFQTVAHLGIAAAEALGHAHDQGVVHRDIKPSNLLLDASGQVWITDFGLARTASDPSLTMTGDVLGTARYMSPEQALAKRALVDHRTDVYSLGVTLYELLTLRPAVTGHDRQEVLKQIALEEPRAPRRINEAIPADLETILLKAIAKEPAERYATAHQMADDLHRFIEDRPIRARRATIVQRVVKWSRRHKPVVWTAAVSAAVLLLVVAIGSAFSAAFIAQQRDLAVLAQGQAEDRRIEAIRERDAAEQNLYLAHVRLAQLDWESNQIGRMLGTLERHRALPGRPDRRGWEWYYLTALCHRDILTLRGHTARVWSVAWSPDGRRLASASWDGTIKVWDAAAGKEQFTLSGHRGEVYMVVWSPDGGKLASGGTGGAIKVWNAATAEPILTIPPQTDLVHSLAWSPDGRRIASAPWSGELVVHDASTGELLLKLPGAMHRCAAWSPDGRLLATGGDWYDSVVRLWDARSGEELSTQRGHERGVNALAFSPDGRRLASVAWDERVKIWDVDKRKELFDLAGHSGNVYAVAWSQDAATLATAGADATLRLWNTETGVLQRVIRGHEGFVYGVGWSPDGSQIASGGADRSLKIWDPSAPQEWISLEGGQRVAWSPDGRKLATQGVRSNIQVIDAASGQQLNSLEYRGNGWLASVAWSPEGERIAAAVNDGYVTVFDSKTARETLRIQAHSKDREVAEARSVAWSPDGRLLATAGLDNKAAIWDAATGRQLHCLALPSSGGSVAWSPDGKRLAVATWDQHVFVWDAATGRKLLQLRRHSGQVEAIADSQYSVAWSPTGDRLAAGSSEGDIVVWNASTGEELIRMHGHTSNVRTIAWSPNGRRLASSGEDRMVKIWDADSGEEVLTLLRRRQNSGLVGSLAWSPDGRRLAMAEPDLRIWDASAAYDMDP